MVRESVESVRYEMQMSPQLEIELELVINVSNYLELNSITN